MPAGPPAPQGQGCQRDRHHAGQRQGGRGPRMLRCRAVQPPRQPGEAQAQHDPRRHLAIHPPPRRMEDQRPAPPPQRPDRLSVHHPQPEWPHQPHQGQGQRTRQRGPALGSQHAQGRRQPQTITNDLGGDGLLVVKPAARHEGVLQEKAAVVPMGPRRVQAQGQHGAPRLPPPMGCVISGFGPEGDRPLGDLGPFQVLAGGAWPLGRARLRVQLACGGVTGRPHRFGPGDGAAGVTHDLHGPPWRLRLQQPDHPHCRTATGLVHLRPTVLLRPVN